MALGSQIEMSCGKSHASHPHSPSCGKDHVDVDHFVVHNQITGGGGGEECSQHK